MIIDNNMQELLPIDLTDKDIIDIFALALIELITEDEYNFNEINHKTNFTKTAVNEGCGCYYCFLRFELRRIRILAHRKRKSFDYMYDSLSLDNRITQENEIKELEQKAKDIKKLKSKIKDKLKIRKNDN